MTKLELEKMFLGKQVKITSTCGPDLATFDEVVTGICIAIREIPGENRFYVEIDNDNRYGICSPVLKGGKCVSLINKSLSHPRIVEAVLSNGSKVVFQKFIHKGFVDMSANNCSYGTVAYIEALWEEVKKDFPTLKKEDVKLLGPSGEFGTHWGITFQVPEGATIPSSYENH